MITELTHEQKARFSEFVKKWTDIGLCTLPADRLRAEHGIRLAYKSANLNAPLKIVWTASPLAQGLTRLVVIKKLSASVGDSVGASVGASVWDSVRASVGASVRASVGDSVWDSVRDSVGASVRASVWASVWDSVWDSVGDSVWDSGYGQHDASWLSFYDYFRQVCTLETATNPIHGLSEIAQAAGWFLPHKHICWISERHHRVCRNSRGQLHSHDGMAIEYPDGWGVWAWNGVRVTEQIILRPDTLTAEQIAKESNAQVRQVMVERIGIEQVCQMFRATTNDQRGEYALLTLDLGDGRKRPYLKMRNPSVGVWHVEGVHPNCRTVQQALNWRNGLTQEQIDDIHGADWLQQGDVILKPTGATKFKSQPIQLT
jgi:hypothetical protein